MTKLLSSSQCWTQALYFLLYHFRLLYVTTRNNDIAIEQSSSLINLKLTMILCYDFTVLTACTANKLLSSPSPKSKVQFP